MRPLSLSDRKPVRARHGALERLGALANGRPSLERSEVHAHPAQSRTGHPGPLVGRFDDHEPVAECPEAL